MKMYSQLMDETIDWELKSAPDYAFLVHSRTLRDIRAKYPQLESVPDHELEKASYEWPAILVDELYGVRTALDQEVRGILVGIPFTPEMILERPDLFRKKITEAVFKTEQSGVKVIGLGGWLPAFTAYGLDLKRITKCGITTGHSYAAWSISTYVDDALKGLCCYTPVIAVVGAAGSTGTLTAQILSNKAYGAKLLLVDLPGKMNRLGKFATRLMKESGIDIEVRASLASLVEADIVVMLTNASESILRPEHLKDGAMVIDDTQPRNTTEMLLHKVSVIDVLSVVPGLKLDYDLDIVNGRPDITFTCLAETAVLAANKRYSDFSIGRPGVDKAEEIARLAQNIGVLPARYVSFGRVMDKTKLIKTEKACVQ